MSNHAIERPNDTRSLQAEAKLDEALHAKGSVAPDPFATKETLGKDGAAAAVSKEEQEMPLSERQKGALREAYGAAPPKAA